MSAIKSITGSVVGPVSQSVVRGLTPVGASGGSVVADIKAAVGTSTNPTSAGTKAVTGVGFTPKVVMPFSSTLTSDGADTYAFLGLGAADGSSEGAISVTSAPNLVTSNTVRRHDDTKCVSELTSANTLNTRQASLSSLDSDGFTLDWSETLSSAWLLNHICLGGDDLEASLTLHQMNATNADESFAHGLTGGAPDALLFFSALDSTAPANTATHILASFGFWAGANQCSAAIYSDDAVSTTDTSRWLSNDSVVGRISGLGLVRTLAVNSVDLSSVNCTYPTTTSTSQDYFFMLALRGCKAQVGTFDGWTSGDNVISCPGINPKLLLLMPMREGVDNLNSVLNSAYMTIAAGDGTNMVSCQITDQDAQTTTNSRRAQKSDEFVEYDASGNLRFRATSHSFASDSVTVNAINTTPTHNQGAYLIIGN